MARGENGRGVPHILGTKWILREPQQNASWQLASVPQCFVRRFAFRCSTGPQSRAIVVCPDRGCPSKAENPVLAEHGSNQRQSKDEGVRFAISKRGFDSRLR